MRRGALRSGPAQLVVLRLLRYGRAGEHLQRPEPEEEDREDGERERAEDRDAQGELRGQAVRLLDARVGRAGSRPPGAAAASQGARTSWIAVERSAGGKQPAAERVDAAA